MKKTLKRVEGRKNLTGVVWVESGMWNKCSMVGEKSSVKGGWWRVDGGGWRVDGRWWMVEGGW